MKKIFFLFVFFIAVKSVRADNILLNKKYQVSIHNILDTAVYPIASVSSINLPFYNNKPINTFLADLTDSYPGYILGRIYGNEIRRGTMINVYYGNSIAFVIVVKNFQYMNSFSPTADFDFNLFRQENIHRIELWNVGDCVHGCN